MGRGVRPGEEGGVGGGPIGRDARRKGRASLAAWMRPPWPSAVGATPLVPRIVGLKWSVFVVDWGRGVSPRGGRHGRRPNPCRMHTPERSVCDERTFRDAGWSLSDIRRPEHGRRGAGGAGETDVGRWGCLGVGYVPCPCPIL
jgi:hypothetical protein